MYIQYGCGLDAPSTWLNFDASPTLFLQKIPLLGFIFHTFSKTKFQKYVQFGDIIRGLTIEKNTCQAIYCSHVLEHLSLTDFRKAISNTYSYLTTGGTFRLVVPDLECLVKHYLSSINPEACNHFMESSFLGKKDRSRHLLSFLREWLGNSHHLWMWDYKGIEKELKLVGFQNIRRALYGDSTDPKFQEVEVEERWKDGVGIECIKR